MQQVNLYQKEFFRSYDYRRISVVASFLLLLLIFILVNFYQTYSERQLLAEMENKIKALKNIEQSYAVLEIKAKPKAKDMNLAANLDRTKRNNTEKRRALNYLSGNDTGNISGFSFLLQGLGRQRDSIKDLWLKKIRFTHGGYHLHLDGSSYQADLLPKFIQALSKEEIYKDREFKELNILRSKDNKIMLDFILDTQYRTEASDDEIADKATALFMARLKQLSAQKETLQ